SCCHSDAERRGGGAICFSAYAWKCGTPWGITTQKRLSVHLQRSIREPAFDLFHGSPATELRLRRGDCRGLRVMLHLGKWLLAILPYKRPIRRLPIAELLQIQQ